MKVVCLGGAGGMGRYAARTAAAFDFVDEVVIADLNVKTAAAFAKQLGEKARGVAVDVRDQKMLEAVLSRGDIVLNTVGPFFKFGVPILKAAIQTGRNYIDLCDDWEPTLEMLDLHDAAIRAGVTAVIGLGASPGITNLLAVLAIKELDRADKIYTVWDLDSAKPETIGPVPSAAMVHGMLQLSGKIRVWEDGGYREVRPVRKIRLAYPGIGVRSAWSIGHPEAITLPRYFPGLKTSRNLMVTSQPNIVALWIVGALINAGLMSIETAARIAEKVEGTGAGRTPDDFIREIKTGGRLRLPPIFARRHRHRRAVRGHGRRHGRTPGGGAVAVSENHNARGLRARRHHRTHAVSGCHGPPLRSAAKKRLGNSNHKPVVGKRRHLFRVLIRLFDVV